MIFLHKYKKYITAKKYHSSNYGYGTYLFLINQNRIPMLIKPFRSFVIKYNSCPTSIVEYSVSGGYSEDMDFEIRINNKLRFVMYRRHGDYTFKKRFKYDRDKHIKKKQLKNKQQKNKQQKNKQNKQNDNNVPTEKIKPEKIYFRVDKYIDLVKNQSIIHFNKNVSKHVVDNLIEELELDCADLCIKDSAMEILDIDTNIYTDGQYRQNKIIQYAW